MCKGLEEMPPGDSGEGVERSGRVSDGRKKVGGKCLRALCSCRRT